VLYNRWRIVAKLCVLCALFKVLTLPCVEASHIDLIVKVTDVANNGVVLHLGHVCTKITHSSGTAE
jgi:hypothetical protein